MRVASDVGGTFTDLVYYAPSESGGAVLSTKVDTTPPDFETGVINSIRKAGIDPAGFEFFAHGATVIINALTERKGVRTALITTRGFRDVLEIARGNRPDLFNFAFEKPKPFVERYLRLELDERVNFRGEVERPLDLSPLPELLDYLRSEKVEAIAVCLLHAYVNPTHELLALDEIRRLWPEVSVLASHQISRVWREYERTNTTVVSAYVYPIAKRYIETLQGRLNELGFTGTPYMMQSNCGVTTVANAIRNPIAMVESGPASGIYAAAHLGRLIDEPNLIALDIGGTTAKCTLIERGQIRVTTDYYIERSPTHPGYPIQTAVSEIVEIGNGGGSIAWVDEGGKLHVGPQSAGAMPGPAAYGRGGTRPTTTDANLVLGRIDPDSFVGGEVQPDNEAIEAAMAPVAEQLGVTRSQLARGIVRIANANMSNALRLVSTNKGHDPRDFALMAFGGGGAMHAVELAEELNIPRVIVPANSAVFSAWGMLLTDLRRDFVQTRLTPLTPDRQSDVAATFNALCAQAAGEFEDEEILEAGQSPDFDYHLDMRYLGQEHTVKVQVGGHQLDPAAIDLARAGELFHVAHERQFTYRLDSPVEIVNFHLVAGARVDKPALQPKPVTGAVPTDAILHRRQVDFDAHGIHEATVYDGLKLEPGMEIDGPAVIQEAAMTLVVGPPHRLRVDAFGNYHVELG